MKNYSDKYVACPFYSSESGSQIRCEGFSVTSSIQTTFHTKELLLAHKSKFCRNLARHPRCPLYPIIEQKYKEDSHE